MHSQGLLGGNAGIPFAKTLAALTVGLVTATACASETDDGAFPPGTAEEEAGNGDETTTTEATTTTTEPATTTEPPATEPPPTEPPATEPPPTEPPPTEPPPTEPPPTEPPAAEPPTGAGTRENPLPTGETFTVGAWQVSFGPTNRDAWGVIQAENEFNEPPPEGLAYVMAEVSVTYAGSESGTPWLDLIFDFVDAAGNTTGLATYCGVLPNDLANVGEMFAGASATGNVCVAVPADQIEGGAWIVEDSLDFEGDSRVFVGLG